MRKLIFAIACLACFYTQAHAQGTTTVTGNVKSTTGENLAAVSVMIKGGSAGTFTDDKGNFKLVTTSKPPFTIIISSIGYAPQEVNVTSAGQAVNVSMTAVSSLGQEVVVAASRLPERILEAPVSIERVTASTVRNAPGASYYDVLANLKGVDIVTSSYTFKTASTRGFNGSGNLRFNQFVDGMDNTAPALNFPVSNVVGLTELDLDNMELLSGPSSALYGSGGQNGTLLINSKDPFKYQGFSAQVKQGVMHVADSRTGSSLFSDYVFRWGYKASDKFAFKIGAEYMKTDDWQADDKSNLLRNNVLSSVKSGDRSSDPNYDGVNVYGDEASASMQGIALASIFGPSNARLSTDIGTLASLGLINPLDGIDATEQGVIVGYYAGQLGNPDFGALPIFATGVVSGSFYDDNGSPILVSRTGYNESDVVDYNAFNFKVSGGLYYKFTNTMMLSLTGNWGNGTTVYTGADRYSIKNFTMGQYKMELKDKNWFLRAYTTQENSGDSYATTLAALSINNSWKDNGTWFGEYTATYEGALLGGADAASAHAAARSTADVGRLVPGTPEFESALNTAITTKITGSGGAQFADKSDLWHFEGQYNFSDAIKVVDVLVGANYRVFSLNSQGTIFADTAGRINISEYGAYLQLKKSLFDDVLNLTASGRYDKNENFDGRFTPRFGASIRVAKDNNFRLSYQQAYRFPTNQDQWINLQTPGTILIGGLPTFATHYDFANNPVYTATSVAAFRATGDPTKLEVQEFTPVGPEIVNTFEVGYRGLITKQFLVDAYFYSSKYKDFIARVAVARGYSGNVATSIPELASPFTTTNYSFVTNSPDDVNATGWGFSLEYRTLTNYIFTGNVYGDQLNNVKDGLVTFFNTPKLRFNLGFANPNFYKGFGFNFIYKWQDDVNWEGTFGTGTIPSFGTLDAAISYKLPKTKHQIKIGGQNILNNYYRNAFGNPYIGGLYYISFGYNVL